MTGDVVPQQADLALEDAQVGLVALLAVLKRKLVVLEHLHLAERLDELVALLERREQHVERGPEQPLVVRVPAATLLTS